MINVALHSRTGACEATTENLSDKVINPCSRDDSLAGLDQLNRNRVATIHFIILNRISWIRTTVYPTTKYKLGEQPTNYKMTYNEMLLSNSLEFNRHKIVS